MGIATRRFIPRMPDLVDADVDDILRMVNPLLQSLLNPNSLPGQSLCGCSRIEWSVDRPDSARYRAGNEARP